MKTERARAESNVVKPVDDCWNRIGVRGDHSCERLKQHIHCRNCPVYSAAAAGMFDHALPSDYLDQWTQHFARPPQAQAQNTQSVLIFRTGAEWLALPSVSIAEIANQRPVHSLPHRQRELVLGLVNVRGELLVCVSLNHLLGIEPHVAKKKNLQHTVYPRLLVIQGDGGRLVFPVDEVHGAHRFDPQLLQPVPATLAKASATYTKAVLPWNDHTVGCLDEGLLYYALNRGLA